MFTMILVISRVIYIIVLVSTIYLDVFLVGGHKMLLPLRMSLVSVRLV